MLYENAWFYLNQVIWPCVSYGEKWVSFVERFFSVGKSLEFLMKLNNKRKAGWALKTSSAPISALMWGAACEGWWECQRMWSVTCWLFTFFFSWRQQFIFIFFPRHIQTVFTIHAIRNQVRPYFFLFNNLFYSEMSYYGSKMGCFMMNFKQFVLRFNYTEYK